MVDFDQLLEWEELPYLYAEGLTPAALKGLWDQQVQQVRKELLARKEILV